MTLQTIFRKCRLLAFGAALLPGLVLAGFAQRGNVRPVGKRMVYKTVDGRSLSLYVLEPTRPSATRHPAIIFFHGGGWVKGSPNQFNPQAKYLAARGMVAIQVEYRLISGHATPQICVEDAKSSVRWVREHAKQLHINPNKLVEAGGSAGGYLAAFATMAPGWNAPSDNLKVSPKADLLVLFNPVIDNSRSGFGYERFGAEYKRYSPFFYVTPRTPPTLIQSGSDDRLIHAPVLETYKTKMEQAGVPCKLILYKGAHHGFFNREPYLTQTTKAMARFLRKYNYLEKNPDASQGNSTK